MSTKEPCPRECRRSGPGAQYPSLPAGGLPIGSNGRYATIGRTLPCVREVVSVRLDLLYAGQGRTFTFSFRYGG
jgi:hypothetical protein